MSVPCGLSPDDGLPVGLQVIGQPYKETELLAIASAYESRTTWRTRLPDL